jgi:hypothetical protein
VRRRSPSLALAVLLAVLAAPAVNAAARTRPPLHTYRVDLTFSARQVGGLDSDTFRGTGREKRLGRFTVSYTRSFGGEWGHIRARFTFRSGAFSGDTFAYPRSTGDGPINSGGGTFLRGTGVFGGLTGTAPSITGRFYGQTPVHTTFHWVGRIRYRRR